MTWPFSVKLMEGPRSLVQQPFDLGLGDADERCQLVGVEAHPGGDDRLLDTVVEQAEGAGVDRCERVDGSPPVHRWTLRLAPRPVPRRWVRDFRWLPRLVTVEVFAPVHAQLGV
jgi:hypothetical protein